MRTQGLSDSLGSNSDGNTADRRIPLVILTGFLGAGKTTVLNYLLRNSKGRRLAVLVNDVGEVNIDAALARNVAQVDSGSTEDIVELSNGCICCGIQDEFGKAVMELAKKNPDCIIVEATGIAEPLRIIESLAAQNDEGLSALEFARIVNLVTLVDAHWWVKKVQEIYSPVRRPLMLFSDPRRPLSELLTMQVECANMIILNKIDLVDEESLARSRAALSAICPSAQILTTIEGQLEIEQFLENERFDIATAFKSSGCDLELSSIRSGDSGQMEESKTHDHGDFGLMTFTYRSRYQLRHDKLVSYLRSRIPGLLRAKGFVWTDRETDRIGFASLAQDTLRFDYLGKWIHALVMNGDMDPSGIPPPIWQIWDDSTGDRRQEIVFIGIDLDQKSIESELESFRSENEF